MSLFLDIHYNGVRSKEYRQIYIHPKPNDANEKELNKVNLAVAESIRFKREISINAGEYEIQPAFKRNAWFDESFKKHADALLLKGNQNHRSSYTFFMEFVGGQAVSFKQVTELIG